MDPRMPNRPPTLRIIRDLAEIPAASWDALAQGDPFVSHAWLHALQLSGCAAPPQGWEPRHLTLWQDDELVGAMPLYRKMNSFGEHVFDFAWAEAYRRHGYAYYPKLVCTVPYTPASGPRLLAADGPARAGLLQGALELALEEGDSSLHCLFLNEGDVHAAREQGLLIRQDVQFHWQNPGYRGFEDFLAGLSRDKRKRIRQDRRRVAEAGITVRCVEGREATPGQWAFFAACYAHTRETHHSPPALNEDFFQRIGRALAQHALLVIAERERQPIASALCLVANGVMYGRSWGAFEFHSGLHFETCYYTPIEYCIAHRLRTFEGGARGEHKLARGFLPEITRSAHWLAHAAFSRAVEDYLQRETEEVAGYVDELEGHSPYKKGEM
jgi:predicted N-acyltransferase